jgi:hypothetical protein
LNDVVNLRMARKRKERAQAEAEAARRRTIFGVSKVEKSNAKVQRDFADRTLDAHRIIAKPTAGADDEH